MLDEGGSSGRPSTGRELSPVGGRRAVGGRLEEGARVEANYRGKGKYFPGKIRRACEDGTFDIVYDDGDSEAGLKEDWFHLIGAGRVSKDRKRDYGRESSFHY